jgi:hypothetical protein
MHTRWLAALLALLCAAASPSLAAQKKKGRPDASGLALWSAKGTPLAGRQYIPGLNAALLLSDEQVENLYTAWRETVNSPELTEKGRRLKQTPNPTAEQQEEVRLLREAAEGRLQSRVAAILTPAQRDLMTSIEVLYRQAQETVNADLASAFALKKSDPEEAQRLQQSARERLASDFRRRLEEVLTAEQRLALQTAAEEQRREAEAAAAKPKK